MKEKTAYAIFAALVVCLLISARHLLQWDIFDVNAVKNHKDIVDTPGCRITNFDIVNYKIMQYMHVPNITPCEKPLTRTSTRGASIVLNMEMDELWTAYKVFHLKQIHCNYTEIQRKTDLANTYSQPVPFDFVDNRSFAVPPGIEFIRVDCHVGYTNYHDYHFFVVDKEDAAAGKSEATANGEEVSVMILGLDALSHLNFRRQMVYAALYIRYNLTHTEFWGYNKVADNTYPNLMPMLSGLNVSEIYDECLPERKNGKQFYDNCSFIWSQFKERGFKTIFAEDTARMALFNYERHGFDQPPTDYYFRPIMLEMDRNISTNWHRNLPLCMGGRPSPEVFFELLHKLVPVMQREKFFSFLWSVSYTHDYFNMPQLLDRYMVELFDEFENAGIFNRTVIFLISDHGMRWGPFRKTYQGLMEERLPLLIVLYPKWFKQKYSQAVQNLDDNSKRLTTPYDVYETLTDLRTLTDIENYSIKRRTRKLKALKVLPRGISLFLPIPETRTCDMTGIRPHWCTCHMHKEIPPSDTRPMRAALFTVETLNDRLKYYPQCSRLQLHSVRTAFYVGPIPQILKLIQRPYTTDITVQLRTTPGMALFESTVRMSDASIALTGTISRLNLYGNQSSCIKDANLEKYCFCQSESSDG